MAFMTNQWLKAVVLKERPHAPLPVDLEIWESDQVAWKMRDVVVALRLSKRGGDFHNLLLTAADVSSLLGQLAPFASKKKGLQRGG